MLPSHIQKGLFFAFFHDGVFLSTKKCSENQEKSVAAKFQIFGKYYIDKEVPYSGNQGRRSRRSEPLTPLMHQDAIPGGGRFIRPPLPSGERKSGGAGGTLFPLLGVLGAKPPRSYVFAFSSAPPDCFIMASFKRLDSRLVKSSRCE